MLLTRAATKRYAFFLLAGVALAEKKQFNVVSFGKSVDVSVNGNAPLKMIQSYPDQPLYHAEVNVDGALQYQYLEDSVPEAFLRHFPAGRSATFNDFFGREDTVKHLPKLPLPFGKSGLWTRGMGQVSPYNETYIPTVHFTGQNALRFFQRPQEQRPSPDKFSVFFICQDETQLIENVSLSAWKTELTKYNLRITLEGNDEYYGRNVFKFRFGEADPTFMREKLYTDILHAVGAPVQQTNLVRVYVMGAPVGLYLLQDETSDEKFLKTEFYADRDAPAKMGIPLAADTGADFAWRDPSTARRDPYEGFVAHAQMAGHHNYRSDASNKRVAELARALHNLNSTDEKAVDEFDRKWFDIDIFFKAMALEYALGHWDSYWGGTSNFVVYDDPTESNPPENYKFYFLDEDFEFTFGSCLSDEFLENGDYTKQSYKSLLDKNWKVDKNDSKRRTMIDKLISTDTLKRRFESILIAIIKHLLNPVGMFDRIDAMAKRYREEIKWDRTMKRLHSSAKTMYKWKLEDLDLGINGYPNDGGPHGIDWGLKPYIQSRANAVAREFDFEYDKVARIPTPDPEPAHPTKKETEKEVEGLQNTNVQSDVEKSNVSVLTVSLIVATAIMAMASVIG